MKFSVSNIAWPVEEDVVIAKLLKDSNFSGIDLALTKVWPDIDNLLESDVKKYLSFWKKQNIEIVGIQSLLFGHPEMELFKDGPSRENMEKHLQKVAKIASWLGAKALIFGSPKNRLKGNNSEATVADISVNFFRKIGDFCAESNLNFCLEPNPVSYGCDFITDHQQAIDLVKQIDHSHVYLNIDTSTLIVNNEAVEEVIEKALPYTGHFHISEPNLEEVGVSIDVHKRIARILKDRKYEGWLVIEMKQQLDPLKSLKRSIDFVNMIYG